MKTDKKFLEYELLIYISINLIVKYFKSERYVKNLSLKTKSEHLEF